MKCSQCDGKGVVRRLDVPYWQPESWDGMERRQEFRDQEEERKFKEDQAPLFTTCESCNGLGQLPRGLTTSGS